MKLHKKNPWTYRPPTSTEAYDQSQINTTLRNFYQILTKFLLFDCDWVPHLFMRMTARRFMSEAPRAISNRLHYLQWS